MAELAKLANMDKVPKWRVLPNRLKRPKCENRVDRPKWTKRQESQFDQNLKGGQNYQNDQNDQKNQSVRKGQIDKTRKNGPKVPKKAD